ncbi:MAG: NTP transferase domain-containing protein [Lentisphaeraceae bacterium]|nr:NTP transferase domain-containing protein [Lentisphaeraceae bacterium]
MKKTLLILAAGMGSRYGGLKQLDAVGPAGETILDYSIFDAVKAGFKKVIFVIRRDIEVEFKKHIGERYEGLVEVTYAFQALDDLPTPFNVPEERSKPWGTGQALLAARDVTNEPFLVINADDYYGQQSYQLAADELEKFVEGKKQGGMIGFRLDKTLSDNGTVSRGICQIDNGDLQRVDETHGIERSGAVIIADEDKTLKGEDTVSMNMWLFSPQVMTVAQQLFVNFLEQKGSEMKSEFYIPDVATALIEQGIAVSVLQSDADWFGVTYKEDKEMVVERLKEAHAKNMYPETLWQGALS